MTVLRSPISAHTTVVPVDAPLSNPSYPIFYDLDAETIKVTDGADTTEWQVERGVANTQQAKHAKSVRLVANASPYGGSGGGVNVDNGTDPPAAVTTLVAPGADVSTTPGEANINIFDPDGKFLVDATANTFSPAPAFEIDAISAIARLVRVKSGTVEIFKVDNDGSLGLNNGDNEQLLQVLANGDVQVYMTASDAQFSIFRFGSFTSPFYIDADGAVHIGASGKVGFLGATPVTRPTVTGSRGGNAALASLLTALANLGLITDSSS